MTDKCAALEHSAERFIHELMHVMGVDDQGDPDYRELHRRDQAERMRKLFLIFSADLMDATVEQAKRELEREGRLYSDPNA